MYIQLVREVFTNTSTKGKIFVNGTFECYSLEDRDRFLEIDGVKEYGSTAIPRGIYEVRLTMSNRFGIVLPELLDVPQFTGIRIHVGNTAEDTDGCILVGSVSTNKKDDFIGSSRVAMSKLMELLESAEDKITIEIV